MNEYVRRSLGGELPVSSLEVDAVIGRPGRLSTAEVESLAQLEPYGSGNPRPVFALMGACVESMQEVGQGRHLKLRLSKGSTKLDAIFFSATAATCGVAPGDRVDAAFHLQLNTFRGVTNLQLQMINIRLSRYPSRGEADALALTERIVSGGDVTVQEAGRALGSREQFVRMWRILTALVPPEGIEIPTLLLLRRLASAAGGNDGFLRAALALEVFSQRGLLESRRDGEFIALHPGNTAVKVDLFSCPYLERLHAILTSQN